MKKSIVAVLLLIFLSFSIMAENMGNMPSSVNEVKSGNEILLKCLNTVGESTQGTEITENNGNNIFLKCLNFENSSENTVTTNKINSKDILLECLDTSKNTSDEMVKNENSDEKILKCSNLVKIINSNELFQTEKIENINGVQLKCSNTVKNIGKSEIPLLDSGGSNDIILKCSNVSEDLSKNETKINNVTGNSTEITLKCSNIVRVIDGNKVFSDNSENDTAVILSCSDKTENANIIGNIGQPKVNIGSLGGNIGGKVPVGPIIGGVAGASAVGAIVGGIGHHKGGGKGGNPGHQNGRNDGGKDDNPKKQKKDDTKIHNVKGIGIQPVNPFWRSNLREAEDSYSQIAKVGFQWVRITASWHRIQSSKNGRYDWQDIDDAVALAKKYNLKVLMQISGAPEWATGADKLSAAEKNALNARKIWVASFAPLQQYDNDFSNFVSALVKRYASQGVIDYEFWNEPGNPEFWHDTIQNPRPNPEHYTHLLKIAYTAAHNAHNDVNVMAGGMTVGNSNSSTGYIGPMEFLERMYRSGAKGYFDGVSHHPYGIYARAFRDNGWANMIGDVVAPGTGEKTLYQIMSENGDGNKKIWPSEVGLDAAYPGVDETKQANVISQILGWYQKSDIFGPLILYQAKDRKPYITSGVVDRDSNGDGWLDVNIDTNGDGIPDANIDADNNGRPDILDAADPENYFGIWKSDGTEKKAVDVIRRFIKNQPAPGSSPLKNGCSSATDASGQWKSVKCWEFKDRNIPSDWASKRIINHLGSYLTYLPSSISLDGDHVILTTRRHCVNRKGDPLTDANATTGVCPAGKVTQYSSGRLESNKLVDASKPFRAEIRARMNWNRLQGMRTALWMQKQQNDVDTPICKNPGGSAPYGSLLILEWFSSTPSYAWPATNISCYYSQVNHEWTPRGFTHRLENIVGGQSKSLTHEWHVWTIEFDGTKVRYYMDGRLIPVVHYRIKDAQRISVVDKTRYDQYGNYLSTMPDEDFSKLNAPSSLIKQGFENDKWHFIFNDYVEWEPGLNPPSEHSPFPVQTTEIDYVRLYQK
ncbi:MAG: beta-galactosidase [Leptotrichia hongkongensis]|uniref:cellulase family glycosylhydrolase n=1 Tax=uncultured Leptotrichia sp. TaxID=159271 RepID=UPI0026365856|nr:cellulase family glycosylhydrolase [uncultured Leptotrichia sp.]MDO4639413.1 beta-galactosidase [Leptotrichia hongkongensis]